MGGMAAQIPIRERSGGERGGAREGAGGQGARGGGRPRWDVGGAPGIGRDGARGVREVHARAEPARSPAGGRHGDGGGPAPAARGADHRAGRPLEHPCRHSLSGSLAGRIRLRADPPSDGGSGDLGDLARPAMAVAEVRRVAGRRAEDQPGRLWSSGFALDRILFS